MKLKRIRKIYQFDGVDIEFHNVKNAPGFSHRVSANGMAFGWLSSKHNISTKTAAYFAGEYIKKGK